MNILEFSKIFLGIPGSYAIESGTFMHVQTLKKW
ncbi:hypothetical protein SAMN00777080_1330 [Aquiflexum balticum DSM 16537]|uniref:Uncharacterized protein n=1 Tax=Aquiflexum balticum DSM 16537 TaxID=758820 RepID=A0A1W2H1E6_9BACT|nr:hypothetical protein SAMN00777080_1330 [Aquiflexum balticum DSM 16537]